MSAICALCASPTAGAGTCRRCARIAELERVCAESSFACACGCPLSAHESYDEDGESCGVEGHECVRTSLNALGQLQALRAELAEARGLLEDFQPIAAAVQVGGGEFGADVWVCPAGECDGTGTTPDNISHDEGCSYIKTRAFLARTEGASNEPDYEFAAMDAGEIPDERRAELIREAMRVASAEARELIRDLVDSSEADAPIGSFGDAVRAATCFLARTEAPKAEKAKS